MDYDQTAYLPNPDETNEAFPWLWCVGEAPAFFGTTWFRIPESSMPSNKLAGERFRLFSSIRLGKGGGNPNT